MKRNILDQLGRLCVYLLTALTTLFYCAHGVSQNIPDDPSASKAIFEYSNDPRTIVVSYTHVLGEIGNSDKGPSLRIYADGHMVVRYPAYMKKAGEYTLELTQVEMHRLLRSLVDKKVMEFDPQAIRRSKHEAKAAKEDKPTTLHGVSDAPTTVIEIRLSRYISPGSFAQEKLNIDKKISWHGLNSDAKKYPNIKAIQNLHAAKQDLEALMKRRDLKKKK